MAATVIDGRAIAAEVRVEVARGVEGFVAEHGRAPGLATVLVGDDPASQIYVGSKRKLHIVRPAAVDVPNEARISVMAALCVGRIEGVDQQCLKPPAGQLVARAHPHRSGAYDNHVV